MSYAEQYQQIASNFIGSLPEEAKHIVEQNFAEIMSANYGSQALKQGDIAGNFVLPNLKGENTELTTLLNSGPVVLNFYRGGWCPFCNLEFKSLHDILPELKEYSATLVGISPETPDNSMNTRDKFKLQFEVLSDQGNLVAEQYGLLMKVPEIIRSLYLEWGMNLPELNGDDSWNLPIPATYVINTDGKVIFSYVNKNYTERVEPGEIIKALAS